MNNIVNKFLLWVVLLPSSVYQKMGIDLFHLKSILNAKLTMDDRRVSGFSKARQANRDSQAKTATLLTMLISLVMGTVFLFTFRFEDDITRLTIYFFFFVFSLSLFLITDFTHVLIDIKDNYIILPKPVDATTFLVARLLHIIIHVSKMTIPMALPGLIALCVTRGVWGMVAFVPAIFLLTLFTIFVVNAAYLVILKIFSPQKFNAIIASIQIGFSIIVYGSFQLLPRMLNEAAMNKLDISTQAWVWLIPTYWFAGAWKFFYVLSPDPKLIACAVLSMVVPAISIWVVVKYFAPSFHRKLSLIATNTGQEVPSGENKKKQRKPTSGFLLGLSRLLTTAGVERGAFLFTWKMTSRNRDFKLKVYPMIGYVLVIVVLLFFSHIREYFFSDQHLIVEYKAPIIGVIYLCSFIFIVAVFQIPYNENFKASWFFFVSPIQKPGNLISGAVKAGLAKFCLPVMGAAAFFSYMLIGPQIIPNLLFGFGNVLLVCAIIARFAMDKLPFSISPKNAGEEQNFTRTMMMILLLSILGLPQYFLFDKLWIVGIASLFSFILAFVVLQSIKKMSWEKLNSYE